MATRGRPRKYDADDAQEFGRLINAYFERCDAGEEVKHFDRKRGEVVKTHRKIPSTILGLARALGFNDHHTINLYEARDDELSALLKRARTRIQEDRLQGLLTGESNTIGSIFYLKCLHGWRDTPEPNENQGITVIIDGASRVQLGANREIEPTATDVDYQTVSVSLPAASGGSHRVGSVQAVEGGEKMAS